MLYLTSKEKEQPPATNIVTPTMETEAVIDRFDIIDEAKDKIFTGGDLDKIHVCAMLQWDFLMWFEKLPCPRLIRIANEMTWAAALGSCEL